MNTEPDPIEEGLWDDEPSAPTLALPIAIGIASAFIGASALMAATLVLFVGH